MLRVRIVSDCLNVIFLQLLHYSSNILIFDPLVYFQLLSTIDHICVMSKSSQKLLMIAQNFWDAAKGQKWCVSQIQFGFPLLLSNMHPMAIEANKLQPYCMYKPERIL